MHPIDHAWTLLKVDYHSELKVCPECRGEDASACTMCQGTGLLWKANQVVVDGVTYVPQEGQQAQQEQPQEEESQETFFPRFDMSGLQQDWQNRDESGGGLMGAAKNLGRRAWQGMKDSSIGQSLGQQRSMFDRNVGIKDKWNNMLQAREAEQQQLAPPNPEADSPLSTEEDRPRSIMDLGEDAW